MTATPEEIRDDAADRAASGVAERQFADRRVRYIAPKDQLEAAALLAAQRSTRGPFIKVGLKSRQF